MNRHSEGVLSQRLDELRWDELRKGYWTNSPEKGKAAENDVSPVKQQERRQGGGALDAPGRQLLALGIAQSAQKAGIKNIHGNSEQMDRLIKGLLLHCTMQWWFNHRATPLHGLSIRCTDLFPIRIYALPIYIIYIYIYIGV